MGSKDVAELEPGDIILVPLTTQVQMVVVSVVENPKPSTFVGNRMITLMPRNSDTQVIRYLGSRIRVETIEGGTKPDGRFCERGLVGGQICNRPANHEAHDRVRSLQAGWKYHPFTTVQEED